MAFAAPLAVEAAEAGGAAAGASRFGSFLNAAKRLAPFAKNAGGGEEQSAQQPSMKESAETSVATAANVLRAGNL